MRVCLHRKRKVGQFREFKICPHCRRVKVDYRALALAKAAAGIRGQALRERYNEEERVLLYAVGVVDTL